MPKTRNSGPERDVLGRYQKQCAAVIHDNLDVCTTVYYTEKCKKLKRSTKQYLEENEILQKESKYICKPCVDKIETKVSNNNSPEQSSVFVTEEQIRFLFYIVNCLSLLIKNTAESILI